jgi:hypothetical protein
MLRHACGFALANKGHDTRALQAYLGHRNIQHTAIDRVVGPLQGFLAIVVVCNRLSLSGGAAVAGWVMPRRHIPKSFHEGLNVISGKSALRLIDSRANAVFEGARHLAIRTQKKADLWLYPDVCPRRSHPANVRLGRRSTCKC